MIDWKDIKGFPDYQISSCGIVKSKKRFVQKIVNQKIIYKPIRERYLKEAISGSGYAFVCLRKNNKHHNKRTHKLVAEHFCEGNKDGLVVHHIDGDKLNNDYTNLEYTTKQKNTRHYYKSIGKVCGVVPYLNIPKIINRINNGEACYKIAKEYGVTRNDIATITKIVTLTGEELIKDKD